MNEQQQCRCVPGQYVCGSCKFARNVQAWRAMTPKQREYDRHFAGDQSRRLDAATGLSGLEDRETLGIPYLDYDDPPECCSCHTSAPCAYCVGQSDDDAEQGDE